MFSISRVGLFLLCWVLCLGWFVPSTDGQSLTERLTAETPAALAEAIQSKGDAKRGAAIFYRMELGCFRCHESDEGRRLGPNLAEKRDVPLEYLIESVLQPSAKIREGYEQWLVELVDGRRVSGILAGEDADHLYLDRLEEPGEPKAVLLEDVEQRMKLEQSSMPEGLVGVLNNRQEFLDLTRYLAEIASGGPARAAQLRPALVSMSLPPLPEYEKDLDHAALVSNTSEAVIKQGEEIYQLICSTCHGDRQQEGSMPTSLKFASGKFRRANDPYSMYLTLTHGYGLMLPQRNLVPRQKYAVVHYIREHFLKEDNRDQYFEVTEDYLASLPTGKAIGPEPVLPRPWTEMDYGPSFFNTVEVPGKTLGTVNGGRNIAQKGLTVRLDSGPGGVAQGNYWMLYDHDTMRMAAVWRGSFLDFNGISFNGMHGRHPKVTGQVLFRNEDAPGWAGPEGGFAAERVEGRDGRVFGPIPRSWAQFQGIYRFGDRSVLEYNVQGTSVYESPELKDVDDQPVVVRHLNVAAHAEPLVLRLTESPAAAKLEGQVWSLAGQSNPEPQTGFSADRYYQTVLGDAEPDWMDQGFVIRARLKTGKDGTIAAVTQDQEKWMPNGRTLFVRGGRLCFDMGWVGAVNGKRRINDNRWHDIEARWNASTGQVSLWVDGREDARGELQIKGRLSQPIVRVGFTNQNFPATSPFQGEMERVEIRGWEQENQLRSLAWTADRSAEEWTKVTLQTRPPEPARYVFSSVGELKVQQDHLELHLPASSESQSIRVMMGIGSQVGDPADCLAKIPELPIKNWLDGGPANWPTILTTEIEQDQESGGFYRDTVKLPLPNPWNARLRITGIDFIAGTPDAMVCSWDGGVWRVGNIAGKAGETVTWQRVAAGLFQPLGILFRDGELFVTCRDQLVRLEDRNNDGEFDFYQCFNNDHQVTEHFHEFAMGLQKDNHGNFYYAKSARHALPALVPHHGTLLKVSADGQATEIVANGFRAANGVCLNPDGSFVVTDQEGHWNPKNRINWVRPGQFYGNMFGYHDVTDSSDSAMTPPLCWITNEFDRSPAELLWVDSPAWGPMNGRLLNLSYGYGKAYVVPFEEVEGQKQGGMCAFDLPSFPTGVMRGRFRPDDGHLYLCGMYAWSSTQQKPGGLYRLRVSGKPFHLPVELNTAPGQLRIQFTEALDPQSVNIDAFAIETWDLKRTANYGSDHYNQKPLEIQSVQLQADGKTVLIEVPDLEPTWGMEIAFSLKDKDGIEFQNRIHNSIYNIPAQAASVPNK